LQAVEIAQQVGPFDGEAGGEREINLEYETQRAAFGKRVGQIDIEAKAM
jgi:hypothetical protein